jgi:hypothetical protein
MDSIVNSSDVSADGGLRADGERFMPAVMRGSIVLEHIHRYELAAQLVRGRVVLDIASGEGYGSALLAQWAESVFGVDIAPDAVRHAQATYGHDRLKFLVGDCAAIPLGDHSIDVVVSFETIEHHDRHEQMLSEIKRVLRPDGLLLMSSPDKLEYSEKTGLRNQFHVKELYEHEFKSLIAAHFEQCAFLGQRMLYGSAIGGSEAAGPPRFRTFGTSEPASAQLQRPQYWIALASDRQLPLIDASFLEEAPEARFVEARNERQSAFAAIARAVAPPRSDVLRAALTDKWYLGNNADVAASGVDPVEHWLERGVVECRQPGSDMVALIRALAEEGHARAAMTARAELPPEELLGAALPALLEAQRTLEAHLRERVELERSHAEEVDALKASQAARMQEAEASGAALLQRLADREREHAEAIAQLGAQHAADLNAAAQRHQGEIKAVLAERASLEARVQAMEAAHAQELAVVRATEQAHAQAALQQAEQARAEGAQAMESLRQEHVARERAVFDRLTQLQASLQADAARRESALQELAQRLQGDHSQAILHLTSLQTVHQQDSEARWHKLGEVLNRNGADTSALINQISKEALQRDEAWMAHFQSLQTSAAQERQMQLAAFERQLADLASHLRETSVQAQAAQSSRLEAQFNEVQGQAARHGEAIAREHAALRERLDQWLNGTLRQRESGWDQERQAVADRIARLEEQLQEAHRRTVELVARHEAQLERVAQQAAERLEAGTRNLEQERAALLLQHRQAEAKTLRELLDLQSRRSWRWAARLGRWLGDPPLPDWPVTRVTEASESRGERP